MGGGGGRLLREACGSNSTMTPRLRLRLKHTQGAKIPFWSNLAFSPLVEFEGFGVQMALLMWSVHTSSQSESLPQSGELGQAASLFLPSGVWNPEWVVVLLDLAAVMSPRTPLLSRPEPREPLKRSGVCMGSMYVEGRLARVRHARCRTCQSTIFRPGRGGQLYVRGWELRVHGLLDVCGYLRDSERLGWVCRWVDVSLFHSGFWSNGPLATVECHRRISIKMPRI